MAFLCYIYSQTNLEVVSNVARVGTSICIRKRMVRSILPKLIQSKERVPYLDLTTLCIRSEVHSVDAVPDCVASNPLIGVLSALSSHAFNTH